MSDNQLPNLGGLTPEQIQDHLDRHPDGLGAPAAADCEIVCIIDRSGSMGVIVDDAIGSFNAFLDGQKNEPGTAVLSMTLFDQEQLHPYSGVPVAHVPAFTRETYVPRGWTALFDAIGATLTAVGTRRASVPAQQRSAGVVVAILTDGHENASVHYSREAIASMIAGRRAEGWEFVFLAADHAAFDAARQLNIAREDIARFDLASMGEAGPRMSRRVFDKRAMMAERSGDIAYSSSLATFAERDVIADERRRDGVAPAGEDPAPAP